MRGWDGEGDWEEKEGERGNYSWYVKLINYKKDYSWVFFLSFLFDFRPGVEHFASPHIDNHRVLCQTSIDNRTDWL